MCIGRYFSWSCRAYGAKNIRSFRKNIRPGNGVGAWGLLIKLPLNRQNTNKVLTQNKLHENIVSTKDPTPASRVKSV